LDKVLSKLSDRNNKYTLQALLYATAYQNNHAEARIKPGIISLRNPLSPITMIDNHAIRFNEETVVQLKNELKTRLESFINPELPISQTEDTKECEYCDFNLICKKV
jgi:CRISPR/Cas system-associated exonuclease Cas4 (RecB family)